MKTQYILFICLNTLRKIIIFKIPETLCIIFNCFYSFMTHFKNKYTSKLKNIEQKRIHFYLTK